MMEVTNIIVIECIYTNSAVIFAFPCFESMKGDLQKLTKIWKKPTIKIQQFPSLKLACYNK